MDMYFQMYKKWSMKIGNLYKDGDAEKYWEIYTEKTKSSSNFSTILYFLDLELRKREKNIDEVKLQKKNIYIDFKKNVFFSKNNIHHEHLLNKYIDTLFSNEENM